MSLTLRLNTLCLLVVSRSSSRSSSNISASFQFQRKQPVKMKMGIEWREKDSECEIKALIIKNGLTQTIIIKREKYCCWNTNACVNSSLVGVCGINSYFYGHHPKIWCWRAYRSYTNISRGVERERERKKSSDELDVYNFSKEWAFRAACKFMIDQTEKRETKRNYATLKQHHFPFLFFFPFFNALWKPSVEYITYIHSNTHTYTTNEIRGPYTFWVP